MRAAGGTGQGSPRRGAVRRALRLLLPARAGRGRRAARPQPRSRRPGRHRRRRVVHDLAGGLADPAAGSLARQAGRHPRLLPPAGPGDGLQPAPGGQQDRPGGDDGRDRAVQGAWPCRVVRPSRAAGYVPAAQRGPAGQAAERSRDQARRRTDGGRGAGPAGLARRSGRGRAGGRARRPGAGVRRRDRRPQRAAQAPPGGPRGHGPAGHRVPGARRRPHPRGRRGRTEPARGDPAPPGQDHARRPHPPARGGQAGAASTQVAPCAPTCASTGSRSGR